MSGPGDRPPLVGTMSSPGDGTGAVRIEDVFDTTADDLWSALTSPHRLRRWIAEVTGDLRLGGTFHARFTSGWEGSGRVEACERPRRLLLVMAEGRPDSTEIEATLSAIGERTRLVIEERGLPMADLPGYGAGWQAHVEDLRAHLAGRQAQDWRARWQELTPAYEARHGGGS